MLFRILCNEKILCNLLFFCIFKYIFTSDDINNIFLNRWFTSKEIHVNEILRWLREIVEIICKFGKEMLFAFMDIQVHLLIHLVDDIEITCVISTRSIFFMERFLKVLKGFVKKKSRPEGSMYEGYIVQKYFFYVSEFLSQIHDSVPMIWLQANKDIDKLQGEVLETNERSYALNKGTNYILYNRNLYK